MFIYLNDGRKLNMMWVMSFYQEKNVVVYDMIKGQTFRMEEEFKTEEEAAARVKELEENFMI